MANTTVNKVVLGNETLIDLTPVTVTADKLASGYTALDASGALITGALDPNQGSAYQDADGYVVLDEGESTVPQGTLAITANGSYNVADYAGATVDVVKTYTATISGTGNNSNCYVQKVGAETKYYTDGDTFTFTENESLEIHYAGRSSAYKGYVTVNGITAETTGTYIKTFTVSKPCADVTIELSYPVNSNTYVNIVAPSASVTNIGGGGMRSVGGYAFANVDGMSEEDLRYYIERSSSFKDITWPDGITKIGNYAFYGLSGFNPAALPDTITSIGNNAFYNCVMVRFASLPSGLTSIGSSAFVSSGVRLTSLPIGITRIESTTFHSCSALALTSLPSGLTYIGGDAFNRCSNLAITTLPSSVTYIGNSAFFACTGLTSISCDGEITTLGSQAFNGYNGNIMTLTSASFPNLAITSNLGYVFGGTAATTACQSLEFCDIGNAVGIAANAFAYCYSLTKLVIRRSSVAALANINAFLNTPMRGYNNLTGTVYVPNDLIASYQTETNWSTLYNNGTVTFAAIEGSDYELE